MYNELMNLSKEMREYYISSEVGQRHLLLNMPLTVDISTDFNINKVILESNKITFVGDLLFFIYFVKLDEKEFFDIVSESSFTICILVGEELLSLNHPMFSTYFDKIKYSMLKVGYNFKYRIN